MKVQRGIALALVSALSVSGCNTYNLHGWSKPAPLSASAARLPVESLRSVKASEVAYAAALLENADFVELSAADSARLAKGAPEPAPGEKVFLLRGLSWHRHPPHFRQVYVDRSTKTVYVVGYSWDGEIFIPFVKHDQVVSPLIASLPFTPESVVPRALLGGDRILGHDNGALHESD